MSPLPQPQDFVRYLWEGTISRRDLNAGNPSVSLSKDEQYILQVLAVTFSSISVASAILAFYWFRRMRRSFRHDLVMFLIQSDMFKALWLMIYPIVIFTSGPVASNSAFCKANGFFIALGIEASDFAVFMIALHSALYIFNANPRTSVGEGGLYPYRKIAFVLWIVFPLLMASLAFIDDNAYVPQSTYCYLPVRPFWYRLALSWIPRYIIFVVILLIYVSIYIYVQFKFRDFREVSANKATDSQDSSTPKPHRVPKHHSLPPTPPLAYNGLLTRSQTHVESQAVFGGGRNFSTGDITHVHKPSETNGNLRPIWTKTSDRGSDESTVIDLTPATLHPVDIDLPRVNPSTHIAPTPSHRSTWGTMMSRIPTRSKPSSAHWSTFSFMSFMRNNPQHPEQSSYETTPLSELELVNSRGQNMAASEVQKTREKIRRQLRFMFIYPLVYITMWIIPFVSHVLQYDDRYARNPPFILSAFVVTMINSQCWVDCWLFSTREKPWRHITGTNGGFLESLKFWEADWGIPMAIKAKKQGIKGPGKSRAEMVAEARSAYKRRDEELAERRNELNDSGQCVRGSGTERRWWDEPLSTTMEADMTADFQPFDGPRASTEHGSSQKESRLEERRTII